MPASNLPGYIMGHRFSDAPADYNPVSKRFIDKSGYGEKADLRVTVGDPIFETVNSQRAVRLNNTWHGNFASPVPWQGSAIFVLKPNYVSGSTVVKYPILFGDLAAASVGQLQIVYASGARRVVWQTANAQLVNTLQRNDDNAVVVAFSISQEARTGYRSTDGVTVSTQAGPASTVNGVALAMGSARYGARFGNLSATAGNTTEETALTCSFFEQHYFSENILVGAENLALTAAFMTELKSTYGAS